MLQRLGKNSKTDSLLQVVNYDFFKRFIKMAANFNRLDTFLKLMPVAKSEQIMQLFVDNLDKTTDLEDAVDVADSYSSINNIKLQNTILKYVKENESDAINNDNVRGKIIYGILKTIFLSADSTSKINLTTEYGIPNIYTVANKQIADDSGTIIQQVFFYGDEDGKKFFPAFVNSFSDKLLWQTIIKKEWVEIKSLKGQKVWVYVNRPLDNDENLSILTDPYRFKQVMNNLIGNATKFTTKGKIEVSIKIEVPKDNSETMLLFSVVDSFSDMIFFVFNYLTVWMILISVYFSKHFN